MNDTLDAYTEVFRETLDHFSGQYIKDDSIWSLYEFDRYAEWNLVLYELEHQDDYGI